MSSQESTAFPLHLLEGLDRSVLDELCKSDGNSRGHKVKYGDLERWIARAWKQAKRLDLDRSPPLDILDVGIGPGYFLYVSQRLGHSCVGLDRPGIFPFWQGLRRWLGLKRVVEHTVGPHEKLPASLGKFDLVTAFRAQFNYNQDEKRLWNLDEWGFFLDHLRDDVVKPGGRLALKLNKQEHRRGRSETAPTSPAPDDDLLARFMSDRGATKQGRLLLFAPLL